jgi:hypothetical protein
MSLHPTEGARYLLELDAVTDGEAQASYRAAVFTPTARLPADVRMSLAGGVTVAASDFVGADAAPLLAALTAIARSIARGAGKRRDQGLATWPRRILRWRGPGRGS